MFTRKLTKKEITVIEEIVRFIEYQHNRLEGHDFSHVLEVCKHSIEIANKIKEPVDPFILICGALLHDIGRVNAVDGSIHGIDGGDRADAFLRSVIDNEELITKIVRVVVRHTHTSHIPPRTAEERIVYDADDIDRLGIIGLIRGVMDRRGTIESILKDRIHTRLQDYDKLHFDTSRKIAKEKYKETCEFCKKLEKALAKRHKDINEIESYKMILEV